MTQPIPPFERVAFVEANGLTFEVGVLGEGPDLALCLHGFPEHYAAWSWQAPMLAARGYQVWAPCLRGYGGSDRPKGVEAYRLDHLLGDVAGLYDAALARGLRPKLLMAHDWGSLIAWPFLLRGVRPFERFASVNIAHPACMKAGLWRRGQFLRSWYIAFFQLPWLPEALLGLGRGRLIAQAVRGEAEHPENFSEEMMAPYRGNARIPGALTAMINYYRANFNPLRRTDLLSDRNPLEVPTLLIWGEADRHIGRHMMDGIEDYVPNLEILRLPGISHWAMADAPEAVNAALEGWLDKPAGP